MYIFPAIDLYRGKAVRLLKGDYDQMTVYSDDPVAVARDFARQGAKFLHLVDLEGARDGTTPNLDVIRKIKAETDLYTEVGGGIRSAETAKAYFDAGVNRVILGTAAVTDPRFTADMAAQFPDRVAVGVDIREGKVAIKGWTETAETDPFSFCEKMQNIGIRTLICTDISRDGAMRGSNHELYRALSRRLKMQIVASGGVSTLQDVQALAALGMYGAIIGKAYYTGAISLSEAIEVAK